MSETNATLPSLSSPEEPESAVPTTEEGTKTAAAEAEAEAPVAANAEAPAAKAKKAPRAPKPLPPEVSALVAARESGEPVEGKVIGWNNGGFHVVIDDLTAFCPRSEMEIGAPRKPESYVDQTFSFRVIKVQSRGRRIVLSRVAELRNDRSEKLDVIRDSKENGKAINGRVVSLTDFGAFVDIGGLEGLVHISEISRERIEHPSAALEVGQNVEVKVLKIEKDGDRISLSMKALEPDPWQEVSSKFTPGMSVQGKVDHAARFGVFVEIAPGLTGLIPAKSVTLPPDSSLNRAYPAGKEITVQVVGIDPRRRRISLALEGSQVEGSRADYQDYLKKQRAADSTGGFGALADALRRAQQESP